MSRFFAPFTFVVMFFATSYLPAAEVVWDGEAMDGLYSTPENWVGDLLPTNLDTIVFNDTSTSDCLNTSNDLEVAGVKILSGYTGTFTPAFNFDVFGDFLQEDGTLDMSRGQTFFGGNITHTGGNFIISGIFYNPAYDATFSSVASPLQMQWFNCSPFGDIQVTLDLELELSSFLNLSSGGNRGIILNSGSISITGASFFSLQNGLFTIRDGTFLDLRPIAEYTNASTIIEEGTGKILRNAKSIGFTNSSGNRVETVAVGADIFVTIVDEDENLDASIQDTLDVVVTSYDTGDSEILTLTETGVATGEFRNSSGLLTNGGVANIGNNILEFASMENLNVAYTDDEDASDMIDRDLMVPTRIWDGEGSTIEWADVDNWTSDSLPLRYDDVLFTDVSTKDCNIELDLLQITDLTIDELYTGTFFVSRSFPIEIFGDFTQESGDIRWFFAVANIYGDYVKRGGSNNLAQYSMRGQSGIQLLDARASTLELYTMNASGASGTTLQMRGDINMTGSGNMTIGNPGGVSNYTVNYDEGTIFISGSTGVFSVMSGTTFEVLNSGVLDLTAAKDFANSGLVIETGNGKIISPAKSLGFTDGAGAQIDAVADGADVYITLVDLDENLDSSSVDTTTVIVSSVDTGDQETVTLNETDLSVGEFRNAVGFPTAVGPASPGDGILQKSGDEELTVMYQDDEDSSDMLFASIIKEPFVWDGGGTTNLWSDAENWSTGAVPGSFDDVLFDSTSSKDCDIDNAAFEMNSLTVDGGYTGSITAIGGFGASFIINEDYIQEGGNVDLEMKTWTVNRNLRQTSGTLELRRLRMNPTEDIEVVFGNGPVTGSIWEIFAQAPLILDFDGDYRFNSSIDIREDCTFNLRTGSLVAETGASSFAVRRDAFLDIQDGTIVDIRNVNDFFGSGQVNEIGSGKILRNNTFFRFTDDSGGLIDDIGVSELAYVTVVDDDENTSGGIRDTSQAIISTVNSGDQETVILRETSIQSRTFRNAGIPVAYGIPTPENGTLEISESDFLSASYIDNEDPSDTANAVQIPVLTPEISVLYEGTPIADGGPTIDLGTSELSDLPLQRTFTINNVGQGFLLFSNIIVTGDIMEVISPPMGIAGGGSADFTIETTTTDAGVYQGSIEIISNDFNESSFDITLQGQIVAPEIEVFDGANLLTAGVDILDFGVLDIADGPVQKTLTVENTGSVDLVTSPSLITGSGYTVIQDLSGTIAPSESEDLIFEVVPMNEGVMDGTLQIITNDADEGTFELSLTATAVTPELDLRSQFAPLPNGTGIFDFGNLNYEGTTIRNTLFIENNGSGELVISDASITGEFTFSQSPPASVPAGETADFVVELIPDIDGLTTGTIELASNDLDENPYVIGLTGFVRSSEIEVSVDGMPVQNGVSQASFGTAFVGDSVAPVEFEIFNTGELGLEIDSINLPNGFVVTSQTLLSVLPGSSGTLSVALETGTAGAFAGDLEFVTNDPTDPVFAIALEGEVFEVPETMEVVAQLLGMTSNSVGLDVNRDGLIDSADIIGSE